MLMIAIRMFLRDSPRARSLSDTSIGHQREIYTRRAAPTTIHVTQLTGFCAKHVARVVRALHRHLCVSGDPRETTGLCPWIPASAGMTKKKKH